MKVVEMEDAGWMNGIRPQHISTLEVLVRGRFKEHARAIRSGLDCERHVGICNGMVFVLYDLNSPHAYRYLRALKKIIAILDKRNAEREEEL
jgi:hypothetical protein